MSQQASWAVDESDDRVVVRDGDGGFVAETTDGFHNDDGVWVMAADSLPRAHLIAAAPDLLEAGAAWIAHLDSEPGEEEDFEGEQRLIAALRAAVRSAILKVSGGAA